MSTTERNPIEVIDNIIKQIPSENKVLIAALKRVQYDASYRPPEGQYDTWCDLAAVLNTELPFPPVENWHKEVYQIVTCKKWEEPNKES